MRIVQALGWYYPESLGGTEVYVAGLCRELRALGYEVLVAAPDPTLRKEQTYTHEDVLVYRYPIPKTPTRAECQGTVPARGAERFHAWLTQQRPDVVHIHSFVTGLGLWEVRAARAIGARVVATTHASSLGYLCQRGSMMRWGEKMCDGICRPLKCAACEVHHRGLPKPLAWTIAGISRPAGRLAAALPGKLGTALGMTDVIVRNQRKQRELLGMVDKFAVLTRWGFDTVVANGGPREKLTLNRLGVSSDHAVRKPGPEGAPTKLPIRVGYMGRFDPIKGVHDLGRAIAVLPRDVPIRVEFRGPQARDAERAVIEQLKAMVRDDPRVGFAPAVPQRDVAEVLAGYDVLCCPAVCLEGGPTVALEAHAVGTPVIGTRIGGLAEMITDGVNGRLVPPGDWRALAEVIGELATNPAGTIDRWRRTLPSVRNMREIAHDYSVIYTS